MWDKTGNDAHHSPPSRTVSVGYGDAWRSGVEHTQAPSGVKPEPSPDGGAGGPAARPNTDSITTHSRYADELKTATAQGAERRGGTTSPTVEQQRTVRECSHVENGMLWDRL